LSDLDIKFIVERALSMGCITQGWTSEEFKAAQMKLQERLGTIDVTQLSVDQIGILNGLARFGGVEPLQAGMGGASSAIIEIVPFVDPEPHRREDGVTESTVQQVRTASSSWGVGSPIYGDPNETQDWSYDPRLRPDWWDKRPERVPSGQGPVPTPASATPDE
jgi:hypothetical protein